MANSAEPGVSWLELRREPGDPRPPASLLVGIAFLAELVWATGATSLGLSSAVGTAGVIVIAVAASWWLTAPSALALAAISFLVVDGFVQDQLGQLGWNGNNDALLLLGLLVGCAAVAGLRSELVHEARRRLHRQGRSDHVSV